MSGEAIGTNANLLLLIRVYLKSRLDHPPANKSLCSTQPEEQTEARVKVPRDHTPHGEVRKGSCGAL